MCKQKVGKSASNTFYRNNQFEFFFRNLLWLVKWNILIIVWHTKKIFLFPDLNINNTPNLRICRLHFDVSCNIFNDHNILMITIITIDCITALGSNNTGLTKHKSYSGVKQWTIKFEYFVLSFTYICLNLKIYYNSMESVRKCYRDHSNEKQTLLLMVINLPKQSKLAKNKLEQKNWDNI